MLCSCYRNFNYSFSFYKIIILCFVKIIFSICFLLKEIEKQTMLALLDDSYTVIILVIHSFVGKRRKDISLSCVLHQPNLFIIELFAHALISIIHYTIYGITRCRETKQYLFTDSCVLNINITKPGTPIYERCDSVFCF